MYTGYESLKLDLTDEETNESLQGVNREKWRINLDIWNFTLLLTMWEEKLSECIIGSEKD